MSLRDKKVFSRFNFTVLALLLFGFITVFAVSTRVFSSNDAPPTEKTIVAPTPQKKVRQAKSDNLSEMRKPENSAPGAPASSKIVFGRGAYSNSRIASIEDVGGSNRYAELTFFSTADSEPRFSADGSRIAFVSRRDNNPEIYTMNADGFNQTRLTKNFYADESPAFSPDGTRIVFVSRRNSGVAEIYTMNADGSNQTQLTFGGTANRPNKNQSQSAPNSTEDGETETPGFSPDGAKIIFVSGGNVWTMNVDGSNQTRLLNSESTNYSRFSQPSYSPDGSRIVLTCFQNDADICTANADGSNLTDLGDANVDENYSSWSPDGSQIAFVSRAENTDDYKITVMNANGGNQTDVFTPDGSNEYFAGLSWQPICGSAPAPLVGWWRGEGDALDSSGAAHNGTLEGDANFAAGRVGQAFSFDGAGDGVSVPNGDGNALDVQTGDMTPAAWVFIRADGTHFIAGKEFGSGSYSLKVEGGSARFGFLLEGNSYDVSSDEGLTLNAWHHIAGVRGDGRIKIFIDGAERSSADFTETLPANDNDFTIGKPVYTTENQPDTNGLIDEVRLYRRALSNEEIGALYNADTESLNKNEQSANRPSAAPCPTVAPFAVQISSNPVSAGRSTRGEIRLAETAPAGGITVNLSVIADDNGLITVPPTVTVPEGSIQGFFTIVTSSASFPQTVQTAKTAIASKPEKNAAGIPDVYKSADIVAEYAGATARATVSIAPPRADFTVSDLNAPASVNVLENFTATWTDKNVGQAKTVNYWEDRVFLSPDNELFNDNRDIVVGYSYSSGALAPNESRAVTLSDIKIPGSAIPQDGDYYLFVYTNYNGTFGGEGTGAFYANNYTSRLIHVSRNLPDLIAENIQAPAQIEPGVQFSVAWDVRNAGTRATNAGFEQRVYFSFDQTAGNADDFLLTTRYEPVFEAGQTNSYTQAFTIPTLPERASGDGFICVKVDVNNAVFEGAATDAAETNNTTTKAARFEYLVPDLQIQTVVLPADVETDSEFALAWTTRNTGNKTTGAMNERVYFSRDNQIGDDVEIGSFPLEQSLEPNQSVNRVQNVTIPTSAITQTGDYFVYVKTDADGRIDEGANENNNTTFHAVHVRRLLRPDLIVSNVAAPATAFFGQTITVQWTIANNGQGATNAPQWRDEVYLSNGQTGGEFLAGTQNASYLNAGESYIASATVKIPRGRTGSYFVIVKTDTSNDVREENETNNQTARAITINVPPLPDLRVSNVQAPEQGYAGAQISVNWTVTNQGTGATDPQENSSSDTVYLSRDTIFDGSDRFIGERARAGAIGQNGSYTASSFNATLPGDASGDYYVFVVADSRDQIYEFDNEGNNGDYDRVQPGSPIRVLTTPPDLTIVNGALASPASANAGQSIDVSFTVKNQGAFDASGVWLDGVYLSADQTLDGSDTYIGGIRRGGGLAAGAQYAPNFTARVPDCLSGNFYLLAKTDAENQVYEFDAGGNSETNNLSQPKQIQITNAAPDLRVSNVQVPATAPVGQAVQVQWTVANNGAGATTQNSWLDRVTVYAEDGQPPVTVGFFEHSGGLALNQSYTQSQAVVLPKFLQGNYRITVETDASSGVQECAFEDNNRASSQTFNVPPSLPDLRIAAIAANNSAQLGQTLTVQWTGQNAGHPMTETQSWIDRVYLSSDTSLNYGDLPLGALIRQANLASGATYSGQAEITIPNVAVGNYFILVAADADQNVVEGSASSAAENNNANAAPITLTAPAVDLTAINVSANPTLYAGQTAEVSWTVNNSGSSVTVGANWTDYVILSRDAILDSTDRFLGYRPHEGALPGGASYNAALSVQIPNGLTGEYKIFVITDRNNYIAESSESNNTGAPFAVNLQLPPPVELNITNINAPQTIVLGEPSTFTWTVQNASANSAVGAWQDSVYLSTDAVWDSGDTFIGQQSHEQTLAPYATYTAGFYVAVPPVEIGSYYVIVRTDSRNNVRETDESNNVSSSAGQATVGVPNLTIGAPYNTTLTNGQERFFSILNTPADETLLVSLTGEANSQNELFTRYGSMVSKSNYEFFDPKPRRANQENVVPNTRAGTYYTMIRGDYVPNSFAGNLKKADAAKAKAAPEAAENVVLKAEILPFNIRAVAPAVAGNEGYSFLSIDGAKFQDGAAVKLVNLSSAAELTPMRVLYKDKSNVKALFDFKGKPAGDYRVVLTNPNGQSSAWSENFQIKNGGGTNLRTEIVGPGEVSPRRFTRYIVSTSNDGLNDAINVPIIIILSDALNYRLSTAGYRANLPAADAGTVQFHADIDGRRVIALYAPVVRSKGKVDIGIDIEFTGVSSITASALPPMFGIDLTTTTGNPYDSPYSANRLIRKDDDVPGGNELADCYARLFLKALLYALSEILPADCLHALAVSAASLGEEVTNQIRDGFDGWSAFGSLLFAGTNVATSCVKDALKNLPWVKVASILYDLYSFLKLGDECLRKTFETVFNVSLVRSIDPNEKIGPLGYGAERFVAKDKPLLYRINFENKAAATAPAQRIRIIDNLPESLDARTVRLVEIGFKQTRIEVPPNQAFYQNRLQLGVDSNDLKADIFAGLDVVNRRVAWTLSAIDPATGEQPLNPNVGLLPPNNENHDGEGYVIFTVEAKSGQPTRTLLANAATIYFDDNEPIPTNATANLLDADVPTSAVAPVTVNQASSDFTINWAGADDGNGSGLKSFDVFVSENGGEFVPFITETTDTSAVFSGKIGRTYRFYSIARDNAGNVEAAPETADTATTVAGGAYEADVAPRPNGSNDGAITVGDVGQLRSFIAHLEEPDQTNEFERADCAPLATHGNGALTPGDLIQARRFAAGLDAVSFVDGPTSAAPFTVRANRKTSSSPDSVSSPNVARQVRPVFVSRMGNKLTAAVEIAAQGDETAAGFTLNFDTNVLSNPTNIQLGSGAAGAILTTNTNQGALGRVGIILDKDPRQPLIAGTQQLITIQFDIAVGAPAMTTISFGGSPVTREIDNGTAAVLAADFNAAPITLSAPTSAQVKVGGRVMTAAGRGIRNAIIRMTDGNGAVRMAVSTTFGYFRFTNVMAGETYVFTVKGKRFKFTQSTQVLNIDEDTDEVNFIATPQ